MVVYEKAKMPRPEMVVYEKSKPEVVVYEAGKKPEIVVHGKPSKKAKTPVVELPKI